MKQLLACFAAIAVALPAVAHAQSSASPYTHATRYDDLGRVVGAIAPDPDGTGPLRHAASRTTYDNRNLPVKVETGELANWQDHTIAPAQWTGFTVHTTSEAVYDSNRRKTQDITKGSDGVIVSLVQYSYDNRGRLECTAVRMNPSAYGSLPTDACTLGLEGAHGPDRITKMIFDEAGQVLQIRKAFGTSLGTSNGEGIADVTYTYTTNGQIAQVIDANGNRAEKRYDDFDRLIEWVFPSKARPSSFNDSDYALALSSAGDLSTDDGDPNTDDIESYDYDDTGNRVSLTKRDGSIINYEYDALNRITRKVIPDRSGLDPVHERDVYYEYDLQGLQTKARFDSLTGPGITYAYDGFGQLTSETQDADGTSRSIASYYDVNGNRTRVDYPEGFYFRFDHDGLNRLTDIKQNFTVLGTASYNTRGLPDELAWTYNTSSNNKRSWDYDPAGRLAEIAIDIHNTSSDVTWNYNRNPASQISAEAQDNDSYSWDGHVTINRNYTTNGLNQYTAAGSASFCYDDNGNLTADGMSVYLYDVENRLVEKRAQGTGNTNCETLSYAGALQAELRYDPTGRLYQVSGGSSGTQTFVYDGNALAAEFDGSSNMRRVYLHGSNAEADDPLIVFERATPTSTNWQRRHLHSDPRGSIVTVTNFGGSTIAINTYDEYGIPDTASGNDIATKGRFRYTGQAWIPELGMYYYKARIYSPTLGRFLQTDPIGYEDQFNLYAYVGNDPINGVDPTGLRDVQAEKKALERAAAAQENLEKSQRDAAKKGSSSIPLSARGAVAALPLAVGCSSPPCYERVYATYTKTNTETGEVYSGRTSIWVKTGTDVDAAGLAAITRRDVGHKTLTDEGFGPAVFDRASRNKAAIRGREQELIDFHGGAKSVGGSSANKINGISDFNPKAAYYEMNRRVEFGPSLPNNRRHRCGLLSGRCD